MEDYITAKLKGVQISTEEDDVVVLNCTDEVDGVIESKNSLIGRWIAEKEANMLGLRNVLSRAWGCEKLRDKEFTNILAKGPWSFDNHLLSLKRWSDSMVFSEEAFANVKFWIRIAGLPRQYMTKEVALKISKSFLKVEELKVREEIGRGTKFFRIRAEVNVLRPIRQLVQIRGANGEDRMAILSYERLPTICYLCDNFGHTIGVCQQRKNVDSGEKKQLCYGSWINAQYCRSALLEKVRFDVNTGATIGGEHIGVGS